MTLFLKRAVEDIFRNRFLNLLTIITISLSILIVSALILFFINTTAIIDFWKKDLRIMAYLEADISQTAVEEIAVKLNSLQGIEQVKFISKQVALDGLKSQMAHHASLFENLEKNPLPDAFEIRLSPANDSWKNIESLALQIESLRRVEEVEYGRSWLGRFSSIVDAFRFAGYAMGGLFFMASVFIVANTVRLMLYSRQQEVEIMRLVGATDNFIKIPFYIEGLIQGALGAILGLTVLFVVFFLLSSRESESLFFSFFRLKFIPIDILVIITAMSMIVGWLGCHLSLKQFLKN
jgi:cell division transport system permease protein